MDLVCSSVSAEVARSSQPEHITQLLQQISTLRDELNHERQQHKNEQKELRDKYEADLQLVRDTKDDLERDLKRLQARYKEDLTRTLKKVEYLEENWTALQTRSSELRSDVDALMIAPTVRQTISDASLQSDDIVMDEVHENVVDKGITAWQVEKTGLLRRQKALEERLVAQETGSGRLLQETRDGLDFIIAEYHETTKKLVDRKTALDAVQVCQTAGLWPLQMQNTELALKRGDILQRQRELAVDGEAGSKPQSMHGPDVPSRGYRPAVPKPIEGMNKMVASPQSSTSDAAGMPQSAKSKPRKRTLSELLDHEREAFSTDNQRRRTGFATYAGLTNSAWQAGATSTRASNGFASAQGDFQSSSALDAPPLSNNSSQQEGTKAVWGDKMAPLGKHTAPDPNFSTTKIPLETPSSQLHPSVSLPPVSGKESFRSSEVTPDSSEDEKGPSRVFHIRSNTQGQSPWKVPVGPRKWQNSALRKDR